MAFFAAYGTYLQPVYKQNNTQFDAQNFILTLMLTQHMGGRLYTLDLHLVTTDISAPVSPSAQGTVEIGVKNL